MINMKCVILMLVVVLVMVVILSSGLNGEDYTCYDFQFQPRVCLPGPQNIALHKFIDVTENTTCGHPPSGYCRTAEPSGCFTCNASSHLNKHPSYYMTDKDSPPSYWNFGYKPTWWQSITWWDAKERSLLSDGVLKVQLVISFNKSYDLTGSIQVTFYSSKPHAFVLERSKDYGVTWLPYRYYANDCNQTFGNILTIFDVRNPRDVYCVEDKSLDAVQGNQVKFQPYYTADKFWQNSTQEYLKATDIRILLEYPWTDNAIIDQQEYLNKYYYDISDIQIHGRCHCNGHAPYCYGNGLNQQICYCQHNTDGVDCEKCLPLYNNKPWKSAESSSQPNPCQACDCNNHSLSCTYDSMHGYGICNNCSYGTEGHHCEKCLDGFYRNPDVTFDHPQTCLPCDCSNMGIINNASCLQDVSLFGQCYCKENVKGRRCDECKDGYYGLLSTGNCTACNCNLNGTTNASNICNQVTGQCACKATIDEKTCSTCKDGYYNFPSSLSNECMSCKCNIGGAIDSNCDTVNGNCKCRSGTTSPRCDAVSTGSFFPSFHHYIFEAEYGLGNFSVISNVSQYDVTFTGYGFVQLQKNNDLQITVSVDFSSSYFIVLRYKYLLQDVNFELNVAYVNGTVSYKMLNESIQLSHDTTFYQREKPIILIKNAKYMFTVKHNSSALLSLDSFIFMADYTSSKIYQISNRTIRDDIYLCWKNAQLLQSNATELPCEKFAFSSSTEWFNGSLTCDCNKTGSINSSLCEKFGGQCSCKQGVMGRTCDRCQPGYYNFTLSGCQECVCNKVGSDNMYCNPTSGECDCKANIASRSCDRCIENFFGFGTENGCQDCRCDVFGSTNMQCFDDGKCSCRNSTRGLKCDQCLPTYFNFSSNGCSSCGCSLPGSSLQQCNLTTGVCSCKQNVIGGKCSSCSPSYFNIDADNVDGCQECFCFNKTSSCSSASGLTISKITFEPSKWKTMDGSAAKIFDECIHFNTTGIHHMMSPTTYSGNFLFLHHLSIHLSFLFTLGNNVDKENQVTLKIVAKNNGTATFKSDLLLNNGFINLTFTIARQQTEDDMTTSKLQSILVDVAYFEVIVDGGNMKTSSLCDIHINQVIPSVHQIDFDGVENCSCPMNYTGLSCDKCATGYTRESRDLFGECVLCNCTNRSTTCDPNTGVCMNCQHGTMGDHCEFCQPNVATPECESCIKGFYGYMNANFDGCKPCNCISNNTVNRTTNVCDPLTGQCPCKDDIGGRRCDRCAENAVNITDVCSTCSECHGLIQEEVELLRQSVDILRNSLSNSSQAAAFLSSESLTFLLNNMSAEVENLLSHANTSKYEEEKYNDELSSIFIQLDYLLNRVNGNLSSDIHVINTTSSMVVSYSNSSNATMDMIYRVLWTSVYAIDSELRPALNSTPAMIFQLKALAINFTETGSLYSNISTNLFKEIGILFNFTKSLVKRTADASKDIGNVTKHLNQTSVELNDLLKGIDATKVLVLRLLTEASLFMNRSQEVLTKANMTSRDLLSVNATKYKTDINNVSYILQKIKNESMFHNESLIHLNMAYKQINAHVNSTLTHSAHLLQLADYKYKNVSLISNQVKLSYALVVNSTNLANQTYNDAIRMLNILNNFEESAANISITLNDSIIAVSEINDSSIRSLEMINNLNKQMLFTFNKSSEALNLSIKALANLQNEKMLINQLFDMGTKLYNVSSLLNNTHRNQLITNATIMSEMTETNSKYCSNLSSDVNTTSHDIHSLSDQAKQALGEQQNQSENLTKLLESIHSLQTLNQTSLIGLKSALKSSQDQFDVLNIKNILEILREKSKHQENNLDDFKHQIRRLKQDINDIKNLYNSLKAAKGCT